MPQKSPTDKLPKGKAEMWIEGVEPSPVPKRAPRKAVPPPMETDFKRQLKRSIKT